MNKKIIFASDYSLNGGKLSTYYFDPSPARYRPFSEIHLNSNPVYDIEKNYIHYLKKYKNTEINNSFKNNQAVAALSARYALIQVHTDSLVFDREMFFFYTDNKIDRNEHYSIYRSSSTLIEFFTTSNQVNPPCVVFESDDAIMLAPNIEFIKESDYPSIELAQHMYRLCVGMRITQGNEKLKYETYRVNKSILDHASTIFQNVFKDIQRDNFIPRSQLLKSRSVELPVNYGIMDHSNVFVNFYTSSKMMKKYFSKYIKDDDSIELNLFDMHDKISTILKLEGKHKDSSDIVFDERIIIK